MKFLSAALVLLSASSAVFTSAQPFEERDIFDSATSVAGGAFSTATSFAAGAFSTVTSAVGSEFPVATSAVASEFTVATSAIGSEYTAATSGMTRRRFGDFGLMMVAFASATAAAHSSASKALQAGGSTRVGIAVGVTLGVLGTLVFMS